MRGFPRDPPRVPTYYDFAWVPDTFEGSYFAHWSQWSSRFALYAGVAQKVVDGRLYSAKSHVVTATADEQGQHIVK